MTEEAEVLAFGMFVILLICKIVGLVHSWLIVFLPYIIKLFLVLFFFIGALFIDGGDK